MRNLLKKTKELKEKAKKVNTSVSAEKLLVNSKSSSNLSHQMNAQDIHEEKQRAQIWANEIGKHGFR
ncbi:hypothetical protein [Gaetbulibacter jejuensis]|uniref:hypothetical protein n=1 Tax=Gaetbulibacter jejuensis TaxID=584607 RepID=UPI00300A2590